MNTKPIEQYNIDVSQYQTINSEDDLREAFDNNDLQRIFDQSVSNLLNQKVKSQNSKKCLYYNQELNIKCAIGHLLVESKAVEYDENKVAIYYLIYEYKNKNVNSTIRTFLQNLQFIHDDTNPEDWVKSYYNLAKKYNLKWKFD